MPVYVYRCLAPVLDTNEHWGLRWKEEEWVYEADSDDKAIESARKITLDDQVQDPMHPPNLLKRRPQSLGRAVQLPSGFDRDDHGSKTQKGLIVGPSCRWATFL